VNVWHVLLSFLMGFGACFAGVSLGGYLVFRTKREPWEPMLSMKQPKGEAFNVGDDTGEPDAEPAGLPPIIQKMNEKWLRQQAEIDARKPEGEE